MPQRVTMLRAISVARSKSFEAPVVIWFMKISSAMRPPNSTAMFCSRSLAVHAVAVFGRQLHGHAERAAARDDRHLVHRIGLGQQPRDDRVAGFVVRGVPALVLGHHHRAPLGAHDDLVLGALEIVHVDQALVAARGEQRRLVHEVGEVGAREAGRAARDDVGLARRARSALCACAP